MRGHEVSTKSVEKEILISLAELEKTWEENQRLKLAARLEEKKNIVADKKLRSLAAVKGHGGPVESEIELEKAIERELKKCKKKDGETVRKAMAKVIKKEITYYKLNYFDKKITYRLVKQTVPELKATLLKILENRDENLEASCSSVNLENLFDNTDDSIITSRRSANEALIKSRSKNLQPKLKSTMNPSTSKAKSDEVSDVDDDQFYFNDFLPQNEIIEQGDYESTEIENVVEYENVETHMAESDDLVYGCNVDTFFSVEPTETQTIPEIRKSKRRSSRKVSISDVVSRITQTEDKRKNKLREKVNPNPPTYDEATRLTPTPSAPPAEEVIPVPTVPFCDELVFPAPSAP